MPRNRGQEIIEKTKAAKDRGEERKKRREKRRERIGYLIGMVLSGFAGPWVKWVVTAAIVAAIAYGTWRFFG